MYNLFLIPAHQVGFSDHMVRGHYLISAKDADELCNAVREIASRYSEYGVTPVLSAETAENYIVGFSSRDVSEVRDFTYEAY